MNLSRALRLSRTSRVALVGAGGKTTALFQAAHSLSMPVAVTSSTHLGAWQAELADRYLVITRPEDLESESGQIEGVTLLIGPEGKDQRLHGLDQATLAALHDLADRLEFPVLVEADGSRQRPLKAPDAHEPVIPKWVNTVVVIAGMSGVGKTLDDETVHRPKMFSRLSGTAVDEVIDEYGLARVLVHPEGGLKGIPKSARTITLLNQVVDESQLNAALRVANLVSSQYDAVIIASLIDQKIHRVIEPCAGVVLAGGDSGRFGQPKMLLNWRGKPLIRHVVETGLAAGLSPVVVVTGAVDEPIRQALEGLSITVKHNPQWQEGQSTSVRQGLKALSKKIGSAVFFLADQPFVSREVIEALVLHHQTTLAPIVAPKVGDRRANPVLFDRTTFPELLTLGGDTGGRAIMNRHDVEYVDWPDTNLLFDIDTPDDYQHLIEMME